MLKYLSQLITTTTSTMSRYDWLHWVLDKTFSKDIRIVELDTINGCLLESVSIYLELGIRVDDTMMEKVII